MSEVNPTPLSGTVECDETYLGSKRRMRGSGRGNYGKFKQIVLGAVERNGRLRMSAGIDNTRVNLHGFVNANVSDDAANIYTDSLPAYRGIGDENTKHETVDHGKGEYVRGDVHTNTIEGAFGLFKRGLVGGFIRFPASISTDTLTNSSSATTTAAMPICSAIHSRAL